MGGAGFPDLVLFDIDGTEGRAQTMRADTDQEGFAKFKVLGAHQKRDIPETAPPVDKLFSVIIKAQPEEAGFGTMANIFYDGLTGLANASGFLSALIDILKTFSYNMGEREFVVTDWGQGYRVDINFPGAYSLTGTICPGLEEPFTVNQKYGADDCIGKYVFTPSRNGIKGTYTCAYSCPGIFFTANLTGSYEIQGTTTESDIVMSTAVGTACTDAGCGPFTLLQFPIPLIPYTCPQQGIACLADLAPLQLKMRMGQFGSSITDDRRMPVAVQPKSIDGGLGFLRVGRWLRPRLPR
jgi:hypothetical protein